MWSRVILLVVGVVSRTSGVLCDMYCAEFSGGYGCGGILLLAGCHCRCRYCGRDDCACDGLSHIACKLVASNEVFIIYGAVVPVGGTARLYEHAVSRKLDQNQLGGGIKFLVRIGYK